MAARWESTRALANSPVGGGWTIFYWAWWIAFAPFVGLFLARISRGRSFREYVLGAMIVPSIMCFVWFTVVGGTAIDLTLNGDAGVNYKRWDLITALCHDQPLSPAR